jgi:hypothetical protein
VNESIAVPGTQGARNRIAVQYGPPIDYCTALGVLMMADENIRSRYLSEWITSARPMNGELNVSRQPDRFRGRYCIGYIANRVQFQQLNSIFFRLRAHAGLSRFGPEYRLQATRDPCPVSRDLLCPHPHPLLTPGPLLPITACRSTLRLFETGAFALSGNNNDMIMPS